MGSHQLADQGISLCHRMGKVCQGHHPIAVIIQLSGLRSSDDGLQKNFCLRLLGIWQSAALSCVHEA